MFEPPLWCRLLADCIDSNRPAFAKKKKDLLPFWAVSSLSADPDSWRFRCPQDHVGPTSQVYQTFVFYFWGVCMPSGMVSQGLGLRVCRSLAMATNSIGRRLGRHRRCRRRLLPGCVHRPPPPKKKHNVRGGSRKCKVSGPLRGGAIVRVEPCLRMLMYSLRKRSSASVVSEVKVGPAMPGVLFKTMMYVW